MVYSILVIIAQQEACIDKEKSTSIAEILSYSLKCNFRCPQAPSILGRVCGGGLFIG